MQKNNTSTLTSSAPVVKKGTSANAFATGSNQNAGNFITDRPTTRVHAPPGGRSSFSIFGGQETKRAPVVVAETKPLVETKKINVAPAPVLKKSPIKTRVASSGGISSNRFATGSNQNCGNFITDRPTTRVHAPPGGRSQITFG